jgi:hypothetical protein
MIKPFSMLPVFAVGLLLASPTFGSEPLAELPAPSVFEQNKNSNAGLKIRQDITKIHTEVTNYYRQWNNRLHSEDSNSVSGATSFFRVQGLRLVSMTTNTAEVESYYMIDGYFLLKAGGWSRTRFKLDRRGENQGKHNIRLVKVNNVWSINK